MDNKVDGKSNSIKGTTGTNGVLNFLSNSGRFTRSTMMDEQIKINADNVPMLTSSATSLIGVTPETSAVITPIIKVGQ